MKAFTERMEPRFKLYFMLGLPTETEEDIEGIAVLSDLIAREYYTIPKDQRNGKVSITSKYLVLSFRSPLHHSSGVE